MPRLDRDGDVRLLSLGDDENRFTPDWVAEVRSLLAEVAAAPPPVALVTTAEGKFWSNGLDLDWIGAHVEATESYVGAVQALFAELLTLPVPTVAAVQGHCFAAGAMLALAHDWRVMRADRGFFCLPEVDLGIPFTVGMDALVRARLSPATALDAMTTGRRYGGEEAAAAGIVTEAVPADEVLTRALARVAPLASKAGPALGTIKTRMSTTVLTALADTSDVSLGRAAAPE